MFATLIVLFAVLAVASANLYREQKEHLRYMFETFKSEWHKAYESIEVEALRFDAFIENLRVIDAKNDEERAQGGTAVYGITKYADMSQQEFLSTMLLPSEPKPDMGSNSTYLYGYPKKDQGLVDWSGKYTTPVKNQGQCGSCWAFSATEQIESDAMRTLGSSYLLSPEQITQCDSTSDGCQGGLTENAYKYVQKQGGIEQESDYPYTSGTGTTGTCHVDTSKEVIAVKGYTTVTGSDTETAMATYVQSTGPLSVCVAAMTWQFYTGGVVKHCGKQVDHCVQAVGVDVDDGYWKVRNSWGSDWGESGYIRLAYGKDMCKITNDATYVTVEKVSN